jgi:arsenate reductase
MRRALAEFIGTALLLIAVIGSGIAAQALSPNDAGLELLENAVATGAALVAIILAVGSVSGAHLNPVVSLADAFFGGLTRAQLVGYVVAQIVATFGLLLVIFGLTRTGRGAAAPFAVGAYITGAYFFTLSTSFANPAVTLARTLSDTFAGIAPGSVVPFIITQLAGAAIACVVVRVLWPQIEERAQDVIVPHEPAELVA